MSSHFQEPLGCGPIIGSGGTDPVGHIFSQRIELGSLRADIRFDGSIYDGDHKVGQVGMTGIRLDCLGPYKTIQPTIDNKFRIR